MTGQAEDARVQIRKNGVGQWFSNLAGHCGFKTARPHSKTVKSEVLEARPRHQSVLFKIPQMIPKCSQIKGVGSGMCVCVP